MLSTIHQGRITQLLVLFAILLPCTLNARELKMVTTQWAPFYGEQLKNDGPVAEIVVEALKRSGHNATVKYMPWDRALLKVKEGEADIVLGAYYTKERALDFLFSNPILMVDVGLVARDKLPVSQYQHLLELSHYRIGIAKGWANSPEFDSADYLDKELAKNQILNIRKLKYSRVDMIAVSFEVFRFENSKFKAPFASQQHTFLKPLLSRSSLHLMVSKKLDDNTQIIANFNRALAEMKTDGTYLKILRTHHIKLSAAPDQ